MAFVEKQGQKIIDKYFSRFDIYIREGFCIYRFIFYWSFVVCLLPLSDFMVMAGSQILQNKKF